MRCEGTGVILTGPPLEGIHAQGGRMCDNELIRLKPQAHCCLISKLNKKVQGPTRPALSVRRPAILLTVAPSVHSPCQVAPQRAALPLVFCHWRGWLAVVSFITLSLSGCFSLWHWHWSWADSWDFTYRELTCHTHTRVFHTASHNAVYIWIVKSMHWAPVSSVRWNLIFRPTGRGVGRSV